MDLFLTDLQLESCFLAGSIRISVTMHCTGVGNSSYMQRLVKGDLRCVFHEAVAKRLVFFHLKVVTNILPFCVP